MLSNAQNGILHLSVHSEGNGNSLVSLWDSETQARKAGKYVQLELTVEQLGALEEADNGGT